MGWQLDKVEVKAADGQTVLLKEVCLACKPGTITLLIGRNGAGKSTLLESMAGLRVIHGGSILLDNEPLWNKAGRRAKLSRRIVMRLGIAPQNAESQWFARAAREELLYSLRPYKLSKEVAAAAIDEAMQATGLSQELLDRNPWTLSGGQQRRLALACLLACGPEWLLFDEPTAGLDPGGIDQLCSVLAQHKAAGRGAIIATHDLQALLPLADAVYLVDDGTATPIAPADAALRLAAAAPPPMVLEGLLQAAGMLHKQPAGRQDEAELPAPLWLPPEELAERLAARLMVPSEPLAATEPAGFAREEAASMEQPNRMERPIVGVAQTKSVAGGTPSTPDGQSASPIPSEQGISKTDVSPANGRRWLRPDYFDPRMLVLCYLLLSAGILMSGNLLQLACAATVTAVAAAFIWPIVRSGLSLIGGFAVLTTALALVGAISFNPWSLEWERAETVIIRLGALLLVMIIGMPLLKLTTPLRLQRAFEQSFGWLMKTGVPVQSLGLIITLIFRFIPLLVAEWGRFAKVAHARGKALGPPGKIPVRMLGKILIPYMNSMLRLAETMADALEARGFGTRSGKPVYGFKLRLSARDGALLAASGAGFALMLSLYSLLA